MVWQASYLLLILAGLIGAITNYQMPNWQSMRSYAPYGFGGATIGGGLGYGAGRYLGYDPRAAAAIGALLGGGLGGYYGGQYSRSLPQASKEDEMNSGQNSTEKFFGLANNIQVFDALYGNLKSHNTQTVLAGLKSFGKKNGFQAKPFLNYLTTVGLLAEKNEGNFYPLDANK